MKKLIFPCTNRVHRARQGLLIEELKKYFEVDIWEPKQKDGGMAVTSILYAVEFNNYLKDKSFDAVLIRGDRYELLGLAMVSAYRQIPIIHLEAGDESGVIDNKVRHAIGKLADYHFPTNEEAHVRLINMGCKLGRIFNYGSLDVEFAAQVPSERPKIEKPYFLVAYHPILGEDEGELKEALKEFPGHDVVSTVSNKDYGRSFGEESFTPEDYVNRLRFATCLIGNSSSFLKEASIFGTPVVLIGSRQEKRLKPKNVLTVPCEKKIIEDAIKFQSMRVFAPDFIYFQADTSKRIAEKLKEILWMSVAWFPQGAVVRDYPRKTSNF